MDGYIRVSRVGGREGETFISPAGQRDAIIRWTASQGREIGEWFEDLDQPGSKLKRPGLMAIMERVESGVVNGIVVAKLDRFTRSVADLGALLERLRAANGYLVSVGEGIDTSNTTGKLVADIMVSISEWELTRLREGWSAARESAVKRGVHVTGTVPLGYRRRDAYTPSHEGRPPVPADARLEPVPREARVVRDLFQRRIGGESWARLAGWLTETTDRSWTVGAVRNMVHNRVYLGEARAGEGLVNRAAHEPLVSVAEFEAANVARGVAPSRSGRASGLLSGVLRCAGCRYALKPSVRAGSSALDYRCKAARSENAGGRCPEPVSVSASVIEPFVLGEFFRFVGDYRATDFGSDEAVDHAEAALRRAEGELDAVLDTRLMEALGGSNAPAYLRAVEARQETVDEARGELARVRQRSQTVGLPDVELSEVWGDLALQDQRKLLASLFDCIFVRRTPAGGDFPIAERTWICWHGEAPELPVRGKRWTIQPFEFPRGGTELSP
jgi:DNA invertase Pin-like site-specific DNA recombinase